MNYHDISVAISKLLLKEPFYGHLYQILNKEISTKIETMAIAYDKEKTNMSLLVNENFWDTQLTCTKYTDPEENKKESIKLRYALLKHEILHIVFKHPFRYEEFANKDLFAVAIDLVVNQFITNPEIELLPPGAVTLSLFPDFKLEPNKTLDYYYNKLQKERDEIEKKEQQSGQGNKGQSGEGNGEGEGQCDGEGEQSDSDANGNGGQGQGSEKEGNSGGKGKSKPNPNLNKSQQTLKDLLGKDSHKEWKALSEAGEGIKNFVEDQFDQKLEDAIRRQQSDSKNWGNLPGHMREYLDAFIESRKPEIDWRKYLRNFFGQSKRKYTRTSMKKESRRFGTNPGLKHKRKKSVLVAVDTSGSVGYDSLVIFFAELYNIWRTKDVSITVVECDTVIGEAWEYKGACPVTITGGGGTDFTAPIEFANDKRNGIFDAIVYFTDGYGPCPATMPSRGKKVLWMICPSGCDLDSIDDFPGGKIKMSKEK